MIWHSTLELLARREKMGREGPAGGGGSVVATWQKKGGGAATAGLVEASTGRANRAPRTGVRYGEEPWRVGWPCKERRMKTGQGPRGTICFLIYSKQYSIEFELIRSKDRLPVL
jgi:hypothetical protein